MNDERKIVPEHSMTIRALIRTFALAVLVTIANVTLADSTDPATRPSTQPSDPSKSETGKTEVKTQKFEIKRITTDPNDPDAQKLKIKPVRPARQLLEDTTKPTISVDAQKLIDEIAQAYREVKTLELAGSYTGDIEAAGQHTGGTVSFNAAFVAPNKFRHDGKGDVLIGSTGEKAYAYMSQDNFFLQSDAPSERVASKDLPRGFREVLANQDPSLRLALAKDPAAELLDDAKDVVKVEDTMLGDVSCPTLKLTYKDKTIATVAVDPATHLIRHASLDIRALLESQQIPTIKRGAYTVDYTTINTDAPEKPGQFAFSPPAGAKDFKDLKTGGPEDESEPAMALAGKDVPDFSLPGLDGKLVTPVDLKGQVFILDFWATWCGPCQASLPHLDKLYQLKKGAGLKVFAVNLKETKQKVQEFVAETKLGVPILLDLDGKTIEPFMAAGIPETVVVGKDGKIAKVFVGFDESTTPEELKAAVEEAMKK